MPGVCAGTLVLTKDGLKPIEQVRIGELVLSEDRVTLERSYKPVMKALFLGESPLYLVRPYIADRRLPRGGKIDTLAVTADVAFRVENAKWQMAERLFVDCQVALANGQTASMLCSTRLFATDRPHVAWAKGAHGVPANDFSGELIYFGEGRIDVSHDGGAFPHPELVSEKDGSIDARAFFKRPVWTIQVADTHTYYVGDLGALVQDGAVT